MTLLGLSLLTALWAPDLTPVGPDDGPVVAAIAYTGNTPPDGNFGCEDISILPIQVELCEADVLIRDAASQGAHIVVLSEGSFELELEEAEPVPRRGLRPDAEQSPVLTTMSALAAELQLYLLVPLPTTERDESPRSSLIAFGPRGRTIAVHHKVELYSSEREEYVAGSRITTFESPWGRIAMMLCSDLYAEPELHQQMVERSGARIVALSSLWTVGEAVRWQAALAHDWGVHVIAANGSGGTGVGSGIYEPDGHPLVSDDSGKNAVLVSQLRWD